MYRSQRSKAWFCGPSLAGIAGSNPAGDMHVWLLCLLCVLLEVCGKGRSLVQRNEVCLRVISKPHRGGGLGPLGLSSYKTKSVVLYKKKESACFSSTPRTKWILQGVLLVVIGPVIGPARPRPTALLSPRSNGKTRGYYCSCWAPDDRREESQNMLSCT